MNVYDFDNTIYDGESVFDFYLFSLKKYPLLITVFPKLLKMLIKYKACKITVTELLQASEKYAMKVLSGIDFEGLVSDFWDKNQRKIKKFYLAQQKADDVIISASWSFLIEEIGNRLGIKNVIASEMDIKTGSVKRLCFREKKVQIFKECFPDGRIDAFYTDSMNDAPMFYLAKHVYIVKGNNIRELIV